MAEQPAASTDAPQTDEKAKAVGPVEKIEQELTREEKLIEAGFRKVRGAWRR